MKLDGWNGEAKRGRVSVVVPDRLFRFKKLDGRLIEMTADETEAIGWWFVGLAEKSRKPHLTVVEE